MSHPLLDLITITQANVTWAVSENYRRIYEAIRYKVPMNGRISLQGDWDFQSLYTIRGIVSAGPGSALPNSEA